MFFRSQVIFNTSVLVQAEFLQKNDIPRLNEEVCCIKWRYALVENLQTFRENAVPIKV